MNWNTRIYSFSRPAYAQRPVFTYNFRWFSQNTLLKKKKTSKKYLALLEDSDGYFQSLADYEALRSRNGYFMEDALATQIVGECENFIESAGSPDSYLITTFDEN